MNKLAIQDVALAIVDNIVSDLSGRSGIGDEWDAIDDDIRDEIESTWRAIVDELLTAAVQREVSL